LLLFYDLLICYFLGGSSDIISRDVVQKNAFGILVYSKKYQFQPCSEPYPVYDIRRCNTELILDAVVMF
jgi:hypothetical protein